MRGRDPAARTWDEVKTELLTDTERAQIEAGARALAARYAVGAPPPPPDTCTSTCTVPRSNASDTA